MISKRNLIIAGLIAILLWYLFILSPVNSDTARLRKELDLKTRNFKELIQAGVPNDNDIKRTNSYIDELNSAIERMRKEMHIVIDKKFRLSEGVASVNFSKLQKNEENDLVKLALNTKFGVNIPQSLGFPEGVTNETAHEFIKRLGILSKVLRFAISAEVESIISINPIYNFERGETGNFNKNAFLNLFLLELKLSGRLENIIAFIHKLQQPKEFLYIDTLNLSVKEDSDTVELQIAVGGAVINENGRIEPGKDDETEEDKEINLDDYF